MAIADMDSDGFADLITINSSEDSFTVHYYDPEKFVYKNVQPSQPVDLKSSGVGSQIISIVSAKNMQLLQSLYVVYYPDKVNKKGQTKVKVFNQTSKGKFVENTNSIVNNL